MKYSPKYFNEFKKRYPGVARSFDPVEPNAQGRAHRREDAASHQIGVGDCVRPRGQMLQKAGQSVRWKTA